MFLRIMVFVSLVAACNEFAAHAQPRINVLFDPPPDSEIAFLIEKNASAFMTAINAAYFNRHVPELESLATPEGIGRLEQLWLNDVKFYCAWPEIETTLLHRSGGYEVRQIHLFLNKKDDQGKRHEREAVLRFNEEGLVDDFVFGFPEHQYKDFFENEAGVIDNRRRLIIVDFLENFRTAYSLKDLPRLEKVFSDDALIIVGHVEWVEFTDTAGDVVIREKVITRIRSKNEYIANLSRAFEANEFINVGFDQISIVRHPIHSFIYGVTLRQKWVSSSYSDEGYLFLMIDFLDESRPVIHVRSWQPESHTAEEEVMQLNDFWIEVSHPN